MYITYIHCNTLQHSLESLQHTATQPYIKYTHLYTLHVYMYITYISRPPQDECYTPEIRPIAKLESRGTASNSLQHTATQPRIPRYSLEFDQNFMLLHRTQWSYICIHIYAYIYMNSTRYTSYTMEHSIVHNAAQDTQFADAYRTQLQKLLWTLSCFREQDLTLDPWKDLEIYGVCWYYVVSLTDWYKWFH